MTNWGVNITIARCDLSQHINVISGRNCNWFVGVSGRMGGHVCYQGFLILSLHSSLVVLFNGLLTVNHSTGGLPFWCQQHTQITEWGERTFLPDFPSAWRTWADVIWRPKAGSFLIYSESISKYGFTDLLGQVICWTSGGNFNARIENCSAFFN